jgi:hypothetical protein
MSRLNTQSLKVSVETTFHKIVIFQSGIRRVVVQIFLRFQVKKSLGSEGNFREISGKCRVEEW